MAFKSSQRENLFLINLKVASVICGELRDLMKTGHQGGGLKKKQLFQVSKLKTCIHIFSMQTHRDLQHVGGVLLSPTLNNEEPA